MFVFGHFFLFVFWSGAQVAVVCGPPAYFINCSMSSSSLATRLPYVDCCLEATDYWMLLLADAPADFVL